MIPVPSRRGRRRRRCWQGEPSLPVGIARWGAHSTAPRAGVRWQGPPGRRGAPGPVQDEAGMSGLSAWKPCTSGCHPPGSAKAPSASGRAEQLRAEPFPGEHWAPARREKNRKKAHFRQLTRGGGTLPVAGMDTRGAGTGNAVPWLYPSPEPPHHGQVGTGLSLPALGPDQGWPGHGEAGAVIPASVTRPLAN